MNISPVNIANRALVLIKCSIIEDFSDDTPSAAAVRELYPAVLESLLASYKWSFANETVKLALLDDTKVEGWSFVYAMPVDCLQIIGIQHDKKYEPEPEYAVKYNKKTESRIICTDREKAVLKYTINLTNPTLFSPLFVEMLTLQLAVQLIKPLNSTISDVKYFETKFEKCAYQAVTQNARTGKAMRQQPNKLMRVRMGWDRFGYNEHDRENGGRHC